MKKNDWILLGAVLFTAVLLMGIHFLRPNEGSGQVEIRVDGVLSGVYPLSEEQTVEINHGTNTLVIKDGRADMVEADCPDGLCVRQRAVSREGESIICLPNRVVVSVTGGQKSSLDAVTH